MSNDVKIYRITGLMLIAQDRLPRWQKFTAEVRALKPEHAIEKVVSELGSRHKVKRSNIKIVKVEEISLDEVQSKYIKDLSTITYMVI